MEFERRQTAGPSASLIPRRLAIFMAPVSLRKIVFGSGIGKPMLGTSNSLSGECRLGHGRDLVIKVGL